MKSLLERSWCHSFGPCVCNITDFYHCASMHLKNFCTPLSGTPQTCFKSGPALANAGPGEESDLFKQDISANGRSEGEQRTANINSLKLGGDKDFPCDANLEGVTAAEHELIVSAVGELVSFSEDPSEWKNINADLRR